MSKWAILKCFLFITAPIAQTKLVSTNIIDVFSYKSVHSPSKKDILKEQQRVLRVQYQNLLEISLIFFYFWRGFGMLRI